ncbi:DUF2332 domain-containing protein [Nocardia panacis]|uniref:DUF2332 domain-containing protein n=1 Tax=Nocardia panacis TaxID=2340916 RepID=A0A3A4JU17_9NOCA|nr:DUF2332 domain-containing protein [Nocardia panacis]RJO73526.1 DUF2332 domain-containing protein [Nocardia panacis]
MDTAESYRRFATIEAHGYSPCYETWCRGIADDAALLARIEALPPPKRQPNLVLGAARYVGATVSPFPEFRDWFTTNWATIREVVMTHRTQTNEAGRSAVLLPAMEPVAHEQVALIEIGAAAGLCLFPDRYSYRYGDIELDPDDGRSSVLLPCATTGPVPIPKRLPQVIFRAGIDLRPLDVRNPEDMRWLECLVWPEQHHRLSRLRDSVAIARREPPHLLAGDLLETVADLVHSAPQDVPIIVFGAAVLSYLAPEARARFIESVRKLPCTWISYEAPGVVPFDPALLPPTGEAHSRQFILARDGEPLAYAGPHGQSIDWPAN